MKILRTKHFANPGQKAIRSLYDPVKGVFKFIRTGELAATKSPNKGIKKAVDVLKATGRRVENGPDWYKNNPFLAKIKKVNGTEFPLMEKINMKGMIIKRG